MKDRPVFSILATVAALSGCGALGQSQGVQPTLAGPASLQRTAKSASSTSSFEVLRGFHGHRDPGLPAATLLYMDGVLYGTTLEGGGSGCGGTGCGTVFSVTMAGAEKVLHAFTGGSDGVYPLAGLIDVNGILYGTTSRGGGSGCNGIGCGTIFSITTTGTEKVLHVFTGGSDGETPYGNLIDVNGTLYGTTINGGSQCGGGNGCGTVYSVATSGAETVLHVFGGGADGANPYGSLTELKGVFYGTTQSGGAAGCANFGCGTVYSLTSTGAEKVLYAFSGGADGSQPSAGLISVKGMLYGTTIAGGTCGAGCGTVFSISTKGREHVLYSFGKRYDGTDPGSSLIDVNGTLYGTTELGGGAVNGGTVYSIAPGGTETVLHSFTGRDEGQSPRASLIDVNGTLYGTTLNGGHHCHGYRCGTVFAFTP